MAEWLVLHGGALGDCVLTIHMIRAMRSQWRARVTLAARSSVGAWAQRRGWIDQARSTETIGLSKLFASTDAVPTSIDPNADRTADAGRIAGSGCGRDPGCGRDHDTGYDIGAWLAGFDGIVCMLAGRETPLGQALRNHARGRLVFIDPRPDDRTRAIGRHIVRQWMDALAQAGLPMPDGLPIPDSSPSPEGLPTSNQGKTDEAPEPVLGDTHATPRDPPSSGRGAPRVQDGRPDPRPVLIHPGSGGSAKRCPLAALEAVMRAARRRCQPCAWVIGPDELEREGSALIRRLEASAPVHAEQDIPALADRISRARLYIGNDAGPTHLAAMIGVPTVAIFGPTDPRIWRPLGSSVRIMPFPPGIDAAPAWIDSCLRLLPGGGPGPLSASC